MAPAIQKCSDNTANNSFPAFISAFSFNELVNKALLNICDKMQQQSVFQCQLSEQFAAISFP